MEPGTKLGPYEIVGPLGVGGMGEVYRARDTTLDREVALKLMPAAIAGDAERLARFEREAKILASVNHPSIGAIYSLEEANGVRVLVLELVEGESLDHRLRTGSVPVGETLSICRQVAAALQAAHAKGIVHRDLKPGNVMVDSHGTVKVLDFGIAKMPGLEAAGASEQRPIDPHDQAGAATTPAAVGMAHRLTSTGMMVGTAPYMSPEQIRQQQLDKRSDIWSFGCLVFELLAGRRPFERETVADTLSAILEHEPRWSLLPADTPDGVQTLVRRCLRKAPDQRLHDIADARIELDEALQGRTDVPLAQSMPTSSGFAAPTRQSPVRRWLAAAAIAAAMAGLGWWLGTNRESLQPAPRAAATGDRQMIAVLPFENLGPPERQYFADGMTEEITSRLAAVDGVGVTSRTTVMEYDRAGKSVGQIGAELGVQYILEATLRWDDAANQVRFTPQLINVASDTHVWAENYDRLIENMFAVQSEIAERVLDQIGLTLQGSQQATAKGRGTSSQEAYDAYLRAGDQLVRTDELYAEESMRSALELLQQAVALDPDFALAHARLAMAHGFAHHLYYDRTESRRQQMRASAERALEVAPQLPEGHLALGQYYRSGLEYELALAEYELAARGRPGDSLAVQAIAESHWYLGNTDEASASYERAFALDPQRLVLYCNAGGVHRMTLDFGAAANLHDLAVAVRPERACPYFCLAFVYLNGQGPVAAREFLESIPTGIQLDTLPPINYPWLIVDLIEGRFADALERLDSGPDTFDWIQFYYPKALLRAQIYLQTDRFDEARASFEQAREQLDALLLARPGDPRLHTALGIVYAGLGRKTDAIEAGRRGVGLLPYQKDKFAGPFRLKDMALIYAMVGETDLALDSLEILAGLPSLAHLPEILLDPTWSMLRDEPRFNALGAAN